MGLVTGPLYDTLQFMADLDTIIVDLSSGSEELDFVNATLNPVIIKPG